LPRPAAGCGVSEFCGWGGIGPVANLIEAVLGFDIDAPNNTITWRITKTECHGSRTCGSANFTVDLVCDARSTDDTPAISGFRAAGTFALKIITPRRQVQMKIEAGQQEFEVVSVAL